MCSTSWLKTARVNSILVEALPLLESFFSTSVALLVVPFQHAWLVVNANLLAISLNDFIRLVEKVICINDSDANIAILASFSVASLDWSALSVILEVVEDATKFIVTCFAWHEVVEASDCI